MTQPPPTWIITFCFFYLHRIVAFWFSVSISGPQAVVKLSGGACWRFRLYFNEDLFLKEYERIKRNLSTFDGMDYRIIEISQDPKCITSLKFKELPSFAEKNQELYTAKIFYWRKNYVHLPKWWIHTLYLRDLTSILHVCWCRCPCNMNFIT